MRQVLNMAIVLVTASAAVLRSPARAAHAVESSPGSGRASAVQDWFGTPEIPPLFEDDDPPEQDEPLWLEAPLPLLVGKRWVDDSGVPTLEESSFPKFLSVVNLDEWRRQDELRRIREVAGDLTFGIPLLVPQLLLEEFIPHGVPVGPTTFLYRTSKDSKSLPLVVFDQALFHHEEFLAHVQAAGAGGPRDSVASAERHVLRRALMSGFRASYALPNMSMDLIMQTAADQGVWGYLIVPAAGGALLYLKGLDQKFVVDDFLKARVIVTSGRQWIRSTRSADGLPVAACELKFFDLPVSVIFSMEMSSKGASPLFIGLGTSLDAVEDLLGREQTRDRRPRD